MAEMTVGELKLLAEVKTWEALLMKYISDGFPDCNVVILKQTPIALHMLGADLHSNLYVDPHVFNGLLNSCTDQHIGITECVLKKVPKALTDPIATYEFYNNESVKYVSMLDIQTNQNSTVVAEIILNKKTSSGNVINLITDIYPIEKNGIPDNKWFFDNIREHIAYISETKWNKWDMEYNNGMYQDAGRYAQGIIR